MSKKGTKALASATLMSLVLTTALSAGPVKAATVERQGGAGRVQTAVEVAKTFGTSDTVVLVNGNGYADAVAATPLAKAYNAPILLTSNSGDLELDVVNALTTLQAKNVIIVGGTGVVSSAIQSSLDAKYHVSRLAGTTDTSRFGTSAAVAQAVIDKTGKDTAILVNGADGYADALSVASIAASKGYPVIITDRNAVSDAVKAVVDNNKLKVLAVGGDGVLPTSVVDQVKGTKIATGSDRFATNLAVLSYFKSDLNLGNIYVAAGGADSSNQFADALVASAAAAKVGAPVVLTGLGASDAQKAAAQKYVSDNVTTSSKVTIVGQTGSVDATIENNIKDAVNGDTDPVETGVTVSSVSAINSTTVEVKLNTAPTATITSSNFSFSGGAVAGLTKVNDTTYRLAVPVMTNGTQYTVTGLEPLSGVGSLTYSAEVGSLSASFTSTAGQSIARGQSLVKVGTLNLTADSAEAQVTGLKIKRSGLSADTDIASLTIWDGTTRLNVPAIFSNGVADITFTSPLNIAKGASKVLDVKVNVANTAVVAAQMNFSLESKDSIKTAATSTAIFPMNTNTFTVAVVPLGTLTTISSADAPTANLNAGTVAARFAKFDFSAVTEDQKINSVTLTQNGSVADTDLTNLKLYQDGVQVGGTVSLVNRKAVFTFSTPISVKAGATVRLDLKGDVVGGAGRSVRFDIDDVNDVTSTGQTYGTTIVATATAAGSALQVNPGSLLVSRDTSSPVAGNISATVKDQVFTAVKVDAVGEPVQLRSIRVQANTVGGLVTDFDNLKLVVGDQVIAQVAAPTFAAAGGVEVVTLSNPITVTPGTPVVIKLTADLTAVAVGNTYNLGFDGGLGITTIDAMGNVSGRTVNLQNIPSDVIGNNKTIGNIAVTAALKPGTSGKTIFANQTGIEFATFQITHNASEAAALYRLDVIDALAGGANLNNITNMKLVDKDGNVVSDVASTWDVSGTQAFTLTNPIDLVQGQTLELTLKGDDTNTLIGGATHTFNVVGGSSVARFKANGNAMNFNGSASIVADTGSAAAPVVAVTESVTNELDDTDNINRNATNVAVGAFKIEETGNAQDASITKLQLTAAIGAPADFSAIKNIRIVDASDNTKVYGSIPNFTAATANVDISNLTIAHGKSVELKVLADVDKDADYSGTVRINVGDNAGTDDIEFTGAATGTTVSQNVNIAAPSLPLFTITPSNITVTSVALDNTTPVPAAAPGTELGRYTIKNEGSELVYLDTLTLNDLSSSTAGGITPLNKDAGTATITIKKTDNGNVLGTSGALTTAPDTAITVTLNDVVNNPNGYVLAPGQSVTVSAVLDGNTGLAIANGDRVKLRVANGTYETATGLTGAAGSNYTVDSKATSSEIIFKN